MSDRKYYNYKGTTFFIEPRNRGVFVENPTGAICGLSKWVDHLDAAWCAGNIAGQDKFEPQAQQLRTENARLKVELERLNAALYLACHRTIDPCPALPCNACSGFYEAGSEGSGEACTRGKMDYFILQAADRILKGGGDE